MILLAFIIILVIIAFLGFFLSAGDRERGWEKVKKELERNSGKEPN